MKSFKKRATQKTLIEFHESVFSQHSRVLSFHPIEEYIKPVSRGYFFVLEGVQSKNDFFAEGLLRAAA
jgi:deferrochelatase/peroxidase EfeB